MTLDCNTQSSTTLFACDEEKKELENKTGKKVIISSGECYNIPNGVFQILKISVIDSLLYSLKLCVRKFPIVL